MVQVRSESVITFGKKKEASDGVRRDLVEDELTEEKNQGKSKK